MAALGDDQAEVERRPGDHVGRTVGLCGGTPVVISDTMEHDFKLQPGPLERAITQKTKWIILNSPSNHTGAAYTRDEREAFGGGERSVEELYAYYGMGPDW